MTAIPLPFRVGVSGTGFIARGFVAATRKRLDFQISAILSRRPPLSIEGLPRELLVRTAEELVEHCDLVLECSGDVLHATEVIDAAMHAGLPVVTMNSEFHVTTGSWFSGRGMLTEAEGDQSGSLAALGEEITAMGFTPVIYGNTKRYLNLHPTPGEMEYWAAQQGISIEQVTAFTDGSKVHIEQALVANGLHAGIAGGRLAGPRCATLREATDLLGELARTENGPIADYVVTPECPGGIFIAASHDSIHTPALQYFKLGPGPLYIIQRPYHLCYLEIAKTIRRVALEHRPLLNNSACPGVSVAAIAKIDLEPGTRIPRGLGSYVVRGECVRTKDHLGHLPIGLVQNAIVRRSVKAGDIMSVDDVDLPESLAFNAWQTIESRIRAAAASIAPLLSSFLADLSHCF
jgi:predicted homoserine dehydrogenase-like protein